MRSMASVKTGMVRHPNDELTPRASRQQSARDPPGVACGSGGEEWEAGGSAFIQSTTCIVLEARSKVQRKDTAPL